MVVEIFELGVEEWSENPSGGYNRWAYKAVNSRGHSTLGVAMTFMDAFVLASKASGAVIEPAYSI